MRPLFIVFILLTCPLIAGEADWGSNPGNLVMKDYRPESLPEGAPLVVLLHGCTQDAGEFAELSGWQALADTSGFALLLPQQQAANNPMTCFNWFVKDDTARGQGELHSIEEMISNRIEAWKLDGNRVYVVGFSAGAAMAGALLAAYPETFAGGALFSGVPYGCADNLGTAMACMNPGQPKEPAVWGDLVRNASKQPSSWPTVLIWHGETDPIVKASNARELEKQWANTLGLEPKEAGPNNSYRDEKGRLKLSVHIIEGMGHAYPATGKGNKYIKDVGIDSTRETARAFGLIEE